LLLTKAEIVELLELHNSEYDSDTEYMRTLGNAIESILRRKQSYVVVASYAGLAVAYGGVQGLTSAKAAARRAGAAHGHGVGLHLVQVQPLHLLLPQEYDDTVPVWCPDCSHPTASHFLKEGCAVGTKWLKDFKTNTRKQCKCSRKF
jgi:hypothetical protein